MKVLIISSYPTLGCGISKYTEQLINGLKNNQVEVISRRVFFYKEKLKIFSWLKFFREILTIKPDVVHIQYTPTICGPFLPFFIVLLEIFRLRTKIVITAHEKPSTYLKYFNILTRLFFVLYERCIYSFSDQILVHTSEHKYELLRKYKLRKKKVIIIPYGITNSQEVDNSQIEQVKKKYRLDNKKNIITFFGSIRPSKGVEYLISSFSKVIKEKNDLILLIAGSAPETWSEYFNKLKYLVKDLKIEKYVRFTGFIPDNEMASIFTISKIIVLPYVKSTQSEVLHQAISYAKPVIVSDIGGIGEIVKTYKIGLVVHPKNDMLLSDAILGIIDDEKNLKKFINNQLKLTNRRDWNNVAKIHKQIYWRVCKR